MMAIDDFGLSVFASWLANRMDKFFSPQGVSPNVDSDEHGSIQESNDEVKSDVTRGARKFKSFDAWRDLDTLLKVVKDPVISILIEDTPSTFYRLPSMVLESRSTGEWYVFSRGRMSFEGNGGGLRNSRDILAQVKTAGASVSAWVVPQSMLDNLDNGYELWPAVRNQAIPLLAVIANEHSWAEIERNVAKFVEPPTS